MVAVGWDSAQEIDRHVDALLREADAHGRFPTPVEDLLEAQRLSMPGTIESAFDPAVLATAPPSIRLKMMAVLPKVEAALDRPARQVHVVSSHIEGRRRLSICHEIGHDILPWHEELYYMDCAEHLEPGVQIMLEQEANYAAIQLLLQQDIFVNVARDLRQDTASIKDLAARFACSIHATFWHFVETQTTAVAGLVLERSPRGQPDNYHFIVRKAVGSPSFCRQFGLVEVPPAFLSTQKCPHLLTAWRSVARFNRQGEATIRLTARDGSTSWFHCELFSNSYNLFLLMVKS